MAFELTIPSPETMLQWTWFAIAITFGRGFKTLDQDIQQDPWFKSLPLRSQKIVKFILDVTHHWWIGALMVNYAASWEAIVWFGWGLIVDDLPDIPARFGIDYIKDKLYGPDVIKGEGELTIKIV